jgi:microcystin-dependent protein
MEGYIGEIRLFAPNFAPRYWQTCDGQTLAINTNQALFAILGTTYGGDGVTTFRLPDLRGRVAIQPGQSQGTSFYSLGQVGGTPNVTLVSAHLPTHTHTPGTGKPTASVNPKCSTVPGNSPEPAGLFPCPGVDEFAPGPANANMASLTAQLTTTINAQVSGGSQPIPLTPPYAVVNYVVCIQGLFPTRD